jgi:hypothetical protein
VDLQIWSFSHRFTKDPISWLSGIFRGELPDLGVKVGLGPPLPPNLGTLTGIPEDPNILILNLCLILGKIARYEAFNSQIAKIY